MSGYHADQSVGGEGLTVTSMRYAVHVPSLVLALLISVIIAAVSGLYPAWRAARTNIVEALAYE